MNSEEVKPADMQKEEIKTEAEANDVQSNDIDADAPAADSAAEIGNNNDSKTPRSQHYEPNKYSSHKENIKSAYDHLPESNDETEIRRQVDFYFSDSNLPTDKYLISETGGHLNKPFPLKEIHSFKRMQRFQPFSAVLAAVKTSTFLNITDDGMITRKEPLSDKFTMDCGRNRQLQEQRTMARSIYAKGFPEEHKDSQREIEDFFKVFGQVNAVRLRRTPSQKFKGSVFVEFADEKTAQDFLALENKAKFNGQEIMFKSKQDCCDEKVEGIRNGTVAPHSPRSYKANKYDDKDDGNKRRDHDQKNGGRGGNKRGGDKRGRGGKHDRSDKRQSRDVKTEPAVSADDQDKSAESTVKEEATDDTSDKVTATTEQAAPAAADAGDKSVPESKKRAREEDDVAVEASGTESKKAKTEDANAE